MKKEIPTPFRRLLAQRAESSLQGRQSDAQITLRGIAVGALLSAIIAVGVPYGGLVIQGTRLGLSACTPAAFFLFFLFLLMVQLPLGLIRRSWALQRGELITIFFMMMVATAIPTRGVTGPLLPMLTGSTYYATPENKWAQLVQPLLPDWLVVDDPQAVQTFYEGGGPAAAIPWDVWLAPLLAWLGFFALFYITLISAMVILRRQWVEHERLAYPLVQLPLAMIEDGADQGLLKPFFKNRVMWAGLAIPLLVNSLNALHHYYPQIAAVDLQTRIELFRQLPLRVSINFLMLGFAYLINANISLSLWFFYLLHQFQEVFFQAFLIRHNEELGPWTDPGAGHQMMGALVVMAAAGIWTARDHLKNVWRKALDVGAPVDDSDEIMSYRWAVLGGGGGALGMAVWLWLSGIPAWIAPVFVVAALVLLVGLARIMAEAGLPTVTSGMIPAGFVVSGIGVPALGAKGMVATGYTLVWINDMLTFMTAPLAHGLRLTSATSGKTRRLFWAVGAALLISLVGSVWFTLDLAYRHGGVNLHPQYFKTFAQEPAKFAAQKLADPTGPNLVGWLWSGSGALLMGLLIAARQRFLWWPFQPLGFVVSMGWVMNTIWFSVFLAWLCKVLLLRYGGPRLYAKTVPFFLGLALGQIVVGGLWLFIDGFTGTVGNRIRVY
ncbi:MAG: hypothetical protein GKR89_18765 [Candidatus Latescibacteria bacterium]|nr:hypothetical protein [Candidatus Latescibacterota bacterium]